MSNLKNIERFFHNGYELLVRAMDATQADGTPFYQSNIRRGTSVHSFIGRNWFESLEKLDVYLGGLDP